MNGKEFTATARQSRCGLRRTKGRAQELAWFDRHVDEKKQEG